MLFEATVSSPPRRTAPIARVLLLLAIALVACQPAPGGSTTVVDSRPPATPATEVDPPAPRPSSSAASLVPVSLEQLSRQADLVVVATVRAVGPLQGVAADERSAKPSAAGGPTPTPRPFPIGLDRYRDAVVAVDASLKGEAPPRELTVRLTAYGEAELAPGERILAFLAAQQRPSDESAALYRIVGLAQGKYTLSADGTSARNHYLWPDGGGWVPLDDLARFVRAASAAPGTPAAEAPAPFARPTHLTVLRSSGARVPFGPSAARFRELADAVAPLLGPGLRPSGLDVSPALAELHRNRDLAVELALPPSTAPDRLLLSTSRYLSEDPLVFVGTNPEPLRSADRDAAQRLAELLQEVSYVDAQGFVVGANSGGRELALLSERWGLLTGLLDERSNVQGPLTRAGWPKASPGDVRVGWSVSFSGWPDPDTPGLVHVETLFLYGPGEFSLGRKRAQREARPALVEYRGRLYAAETAAPATIERHLEPTGDRVAAGGRTTYGVGAEIFRVKGDADGELLVLRLPGADGEQPAANLTAPHAQTAEYQLWRLFEPARPSAGRRTTAPAPG